MQSHENALNCPFSMAQPCNFASDHSMLLMLHKDSVELEFLGVLLVILQPEVGLSTTCTIFIYLFIKEFPPHCVDN